SAGAYNLQAIATDNSGLTSTSAPVGVLVGAQSYLTDFTWTAMTNGLGPMEKDRSNGGAAAGDGRTISIHGRRYLRGLGGAAPSDVKYAINGGCLAFQADIGVDDEVGNRGTVGFQVWTDGVKVFDSGMLGGSSAIKTLNIDLTNHKVLELVMTDG